MSITVNKSVTNIIVTKDENSINVSSPTPTITVSALGVQGVPGPSAVWGDISGTISDQTDLQSALDGKLTQADSNIVNQADSGDKAFTYTSGLLTSIAITDTATFTNNSKSYVYSSGILQTVTHIFTYESQVWTVTETYSNIAGQITGKVTTVNKV